MEKKEKIGAFLTLLFLGVAAVLGVLQITPPQPAGLEVARERFSAERALTHLEVIGEKPRVPGEPFHQNSREYISGYLDQLGIETEIQDIINISPDLRQVPFSSGKVKNIIGFLPGLDPQGTILLMAHYDSVPTGPGVGDDAVAVASMLETARAVKAGEGLRNNIIFLFTDGHEYGLLGARAFLNEHPLAHEIELVFNFEGQGPRGPVYMFETSETGRELIGGLKRGVARPLASSLSEDVYDLLNFDNDFRLFADRNYPGLGMAIVSDMAYYHSAKDNLKRLDLATLQHQGDYVLGLAEYFGNHNMENLEKEDLVFFNLTGEHLIYYSQFWGIPLSIFGALLTLFIWIFRKPKLSGILTGILLLLVSIGICVGLVFSLKELAGWNVDTYRSNYLQGGLAGLTISFTLALFFLGSRSFSPRDMGWGVMVIWAILAVGSAFFLPGGSYIFIWPLLVGLIYFLLPEKIESFIPLGLLAAMAQVFFLVPLIIILYRALAMDLPEAATVLVILLVGLLVPALKGVFSNLGWWLPGTALIVGLIFLLSGFAPHDYEHPRRNTLIYHIDADQDQAEWVTLDNEMDRWLEEYFGANPLKKEVRAISPFFPVKYFQDHAPVLDLQAPEVEIMEETFLGENRLLRFRVYSPRNASVINIYLEHGTRIISSQIGGKMVTREFSPEWYWGLRFFGLPPEGLELELVIPAEQEFELLLVDQSFGLEGLETIGWKARPDNKMADPNFYRLTDSIFISRSFKF